MNRPWIAFFSQTGSEIVEVSKLLGRWPDMIITNERPEHLRKIHPALENKHVIFVDNKPSEEELFPLLAQYDNALITLHGWLRIMPPDICNRFEIYNGHPGLITEYPELKGKDPQKKAWDLNLPTSGCIIHRVTEELDGGTIMRSKEISIRNLDMNTMFEKLHDISIQQWASFLKRHWL